MKTEEELIGLKLAIAMRDKYLEKDLLADVLLMNQIIAHIEALEGINGYDEYRYLKQFATDVANYLDTTNLTSIGHKSIWHREAIRLRDCKDNSA